MNASFESVTEEFPQTGTTLPPQTQGSVKGHVQVICHCIMWKDEHLFNNHGELAIKWWGEPDPGIYLSPPTCNAGNMQEIEKKIPTVEQRYLVEVKYPVRCARNALAKYFKDFGALPVIVSLIKKDNSEPVKVGETFVTLGQFMEGEPFQKRWFSVHDKSGNSVASVLLEVNVQHSEPYSPPELKSEKKNIKKNTKNPTSSRKDQQHNEQAQKQSKVEKAESKPEKNMNPKSEAKKRQSTDKMEQEVPSHKKSNEKPKSATKKLESVTKITPKPILKETPKSISKPIIPEDTELTISPIITRIQPQSREKPKPIHSNLSHEPYNSDKIITTLDESVAPLKIPDSPRNLGLESIQEKQSLDLNIKPSTQKVEGEQDKNTSYRKAETNIPKQQSINTHDEDHYLDYVLNNAANLAKGMNDFISNNRAQMFDPETAETFHRPDDYMYTPPGMDYLNSQYRDFDDNVEIDDDFSASISSTSSIGDDNSLDDDELPSSILPRHQTSVHAPTYTSIPPYNPQPVSQAPYPHQSSNTPNPNYQQPLQHYNQVPLQNLPPQSIRIDANVNINGSRYTSRNVDIQYNGSNVSDESRVEDSIEEDSSEHEKSEQYTSPIVKKSHPSRSPKIEAPIPKVFQGSPKESFCFLVHISTGKLLGNHRSEHFNLSCRLPYLEENEKRSIFAFHNRDHSPLGIFHIFTIQPTDIEFFKEMDKRSFVIELSEAGGDYLGVATLPLTKFYNCFSEEFEWKPKNAVYGYNGELLATNPLTGEDVAEFRILTAFGTESQIKDLQQIILPPKRIVYDLTGKPSTKKLSQVIPIESIDLDRHNQPSRTEEIKIDRNEPPVEIKTKHQMKKQDNGSFNPEQRMLKKSNSQTDVPIQRSTISVEVIRASGLQQAAKVAQKKYSNMEYSCQNGVNPFVKFRIFSEHLYDDDYLVQSDFETPIVGRTFCPLWHFSKSFKFHFNEESYKFLETGDAEFMLFHHFPKAIAETMKSNNVLLGSVQIPLITLLLRKAGIRNWFTLYSDDGEEVGAIEIQITLDEDTKRILKLTDDTASLELYSSDSDDDLLPPHMDLGPRATYFPSSKSKKSMCKVTCSIEEIFIPQDIIIKHTPEYTKRHHSLFECQYFIVYDHVDTSHIESRLYRASNSVNHLSLKHTSTVTMPEDDIFINTLKEKQLNIDLYCCIDTRNDDERYVRENAIFLGCAQIHLSRLHEKLQTDKSDLVWIGGLFPLINPSADSLKNGKMRVRIIFDRLTDTPTVKETLKQLHMEETQRSVAIDLEEEIRESLQSGFNVRSSVRRKAVLNHTPAPVIRDDPSVIHRVLSSKEKQLQEIQELNYEEEFSKLEKSPNHDELPKKSPINYLNIAIHSALHLPSIQSKSSFKTTPPSSYVSIIAPNYEGDPPTMWKSVAKTSIVHNQNSPTWNFTYRLPIYDIVDKIYMQVFHKYNDGIKERDILIGDVLIELDLLKFGCDVVEGWFLIVNPSTSKQSNASLNVTVRPEKLFTSEYHPDDLSSSVQLPEKEEEFVLHEDYSLQDSLHLTNLSPLDNYDFHYKKESNPKLNIQLSSNHRAPSEEENLSLNSNVENHDTDTSELKSRLESCLKDLDNFSVLHKS